MSRYGKEGKWSFWKGVFPWLLWTAGFFVLEALGLRREGDKRPPLTYVIRRYLPAWLVFAGIGWLFWHFTATYLI